MCDGARDGRFIDNPFGTRGQQTCRPVDAVDRHPGDLSRPNTNQPARGHRIYPFLLRSVKIERPNQLRAGHISYIRMRHGFVYLVALVDVFTRRVFVASHVDYHRSSVRR